MIPLKCTSRQTILVLDIQFKIIRSIKISKYDLFNCKILLTKKRTLCINSDCNFFLYFSISLYGALLLIKGVQKKGMSIFLGTMNKDEPFTILFTIFTFTIISVWKSDKIIRGAMPYLLILGSWTLECSNKSTTSLGI